MPEVLPNFLIVGAAKSGTTSLYYYLKEHPEIYLPNRKELRFFSQMKGDFRGPGDENVNNSIITDLKNYLYFYKEVKGELAIGDISPDYLFYYKNSIPNIKKNLNSPKIIISLRNPIDRAFSQYLHFVRENRENLSFEEALKQEEMRKQQNWEWAWFYKDVGFYYKQVKAYVENFQEVKIYLYDDLKNKPLKLIQDICRFLEVDDSFVPSTLGVKFNVSGIPKNKLLHQFLTKPNIIKKAVKPFLPAGFRRKLLNSVVQKNLVKPQMNPETREYLKGIYKEDILKLQELLNRDLTHWLR